MIKFEGPVLISRYIKNVGLYNAHHDPLFLCEYDRDKENAIKPLSPGIMTTMIIEVGQCHLAKY